MTQTEALNLLTARSNSLLEASEDDYIRALYRRWDEFEARITADLAAIHMKLFNGEKPTFQQFQVAQGDLQVARTIQYELDRLHADVISGQLDALVNQYKDAYNVSAWTIDETTPPNIEIDYALPPENQLRQFVSGDWESETFKTYNEKEYYFLAQDLQKQVTLAMLQGKSVKELSAQIEDIIGDDSSGYKYRAERIARQELLRAANTATDHIYTQNDDILDDWYWITRALGDGRLCEKCRERAGKTYEEVLEIAAMQELEVDPPAHILCACRWGARVKKWKDLLPPELAQGVEDFTYEDEYPHPMSFVKWSDKYLTDSEVGAIG